MEDAELFDPLLAIAGDPLRYGQRHRLSQPLSDCQWRDLSLSGEAMKAVGASVRYTEYPDMGHNAWDRAYVEPEFPKWLLEQKKQ